MNKVAAEKIAQEYYNIGVQLAMQNSGLVKEAGLPKEIIKKLVQAPSAALGGLGAGAAYYLAPLKVPPKLALSSLPEYMNWAKKVSTIDDPALVGVKAYMDNYWQAMQKSGDYLTPTTALALLGVGAMGAGTMAGSHLAGKGVDLVHRGGSKALDALKKLRT